MSFKLVAEVLDIKVGNPLRKMVLIKLADQANDDGVCWPSYESIAKTCEISRRSVISHIQWLEEHGFLRIEKRYNAAESKNFSNNYHLTLRNGKQAVKTKCKSRTSAANPLGGANAALGGANDSLSNGENAAPKPISKPTNESIKVSVSFDDFWNLYDKKRGDKDKIEKKWQSLKDSEREAIMNHLPLYKKSQPNKKYRKDPSTYLNNKSWNDEIIFDDGQQTVSHDYTEQVAAPVFDEVVLKTDPKVLAMIAAKRKGGSHGTA